MIVNAKLLCCMIGVGIITLVAEWYTEEIPVQASPVETRGFHSFNQWSRNVQSLDEWNKLYEHLVQTDKKDTIRLLVKQKKYQPYLWFSHWAFVLLLLLFLYQQKGLSLRGVKLGLWSATCKLLCNNFNRMTLLLFFDDLLQGKAIESKDHDMHFIVLQCTGIIRLAMTTVTLFVIAIGYLYYLCPLPKRWLSIPRYLGSKDMIYTTVYGVTGACSLLATCFPSFRFLDDAVHKLTCVGYLCSLCQAGFTWLMTPTSRKKTKSEKKSQ